jgi:hypothetical protein
MWNTATRRNRRYALAPAIAGLLLSIGASPPAGAENPTARAPRSPTTLSATSTRRTIALAWKAPKAQPAAVRYGVYLSGKRIGATSKTRYVVKGLACGRSYSLGVDAVAATDRRSPITSVVASTRRCPAVTSPRGRARTLPFGVWGNYPQAWGGTFSGGEVNVTPANMRGRLKKLRAAGMRVIVSMAAGSKSDYQNSDETFSMAMWKARLDAFRRVDFREFLRDGTIVAQMLIDDLDKSHWGGKPISNDELDELARYSKQFWPSLRTAVRARPTSLPTAPYGGLGTPHRWRFLDAAWDQYSAKFGDVAKQIAAEVASAKRQRLGLVVGLNVLTGGDGSSGLPGPDKYSTQWAMSPAELVRYGRPLIKNPYACAFLMWSAKYDYSSSWASLHYTYFKRREVQQAMRTLRALADSRPAAPCSPAAP